MIFYLIHERYDPDFYIRTDVCIENRIVISISMIKVKSMELNLWHKSANYTDEKPVYYMNKHEFKKVYGE